MPRQWQHASASQIRTALACRRRWWFVQVSDLDAPPPTDAQTRGRTVHAAVEAALTTGQAPTDDAVAAALYARLVELVGKHRTDATLRSEQRIALRCREVDVVGYIDLLALSDRCTVYDYKTTSDWQYAQSPEQLANDVQMRLYAHAVALQYGVDEVDVVHVVAHKKTREIRETRWTLRADKLRRWWSGPVEALLAELSNHAAARTADDVPADASACGQYGGCAYLDHCAMGRKNNKDSPYKAMGEKDMSTLRDLIKQRHAAGQNTPAAASTPAGAMAPAPSPVEASPAPATPQQSLVADPTPTRKPAPRATASVDYVAAAVALVPLCTPGRKLSAMELKQAVGSALGLQRVAWVHVEQAVERLRGLGVRGELSATAFVVESVKASVEAAVDAETNPSGWPEPGVEAVAVMTFPPSVLHALQEESNASTPPEPVVEAPVVVEDSAVVEAPAPVTEPEPTEQSEPQAKPRHDDIGVTLSLFIDCMPDCAFSWLDDVLAPYIADLTQVMGHHPFLADYRQGERKLAAGLAGETLTGCIVVDSQHGAWRELSQVLIPQAQLVVRGLR